VALDRDTLDALAALVAYPDEGWLERVEALRRRLPDAAAARLARLAEALAALSPGEIEELYTRTFDLAEDATLDLGWHLFGEAYGRGAFLVRLRELMRRAGVAPGTELPDHLGHVLRVLGRIDEAEARALTAESVAPALARIAGTLADRRSPLLELIEAVREVLGVRDVAPARRPAPLPVLGGAE
jgi:nitrate reductase delta subunit